MIDRFPVFTHTRTGREGELHDATLDVVKAVVAARNAEGLPLSVQLAVSRLALLFRASEEISNAMKGKL